MKITYTDIYRYSIPMQLFAIATGTINYAENVFIRVYTDEGIYAAENSLARKSIVSKKQIQLTLQYYIFHQ